MRIIQACSPEETKRMTTAQLREGYAIESLFVEGQIRMVYSFVDRYIVGGVLPVEEPIELPAERAHTGTDYFLQRRELGVINIGGRGTVTVDGTDYELAAKDCLYVGMGHEAVIFSSLDSSHPARFYLVSTPAHHAYPTALIGLEQAEPVRLGSIQTSNERTIHKYIHADGVRSCQLVMGLTKLEPGNIWNTMPAHTHDRRSEVYFYCEMAEDAAVFHMMGEPNETRHIVLRNEQAVISPSWSIHSGAGTGSYTFIWAMAGENQQFTDMDPVAIKDLL